MLATSFSRIVIGVQLQRPLESNTDHIRQCWSNTSPLYLKKNKKCCHEFRYNAIHCFPKHWLDGQTMPFQPFGWSLVHTNHYFSFNPVGWMTKKIWKSLEGATVLRIRCWYSDLPLELLGWQPEHSAQRSHCCWSGAEGQTLYSDVVHFCWTSWHSHGPNGSTTFSQCVRPFDL